MFSYFKQSWKSVRTTYVEKNRLTNTKSPFNMPDQGSNTRAEAFRHAFALTSVVELGMLSSSHSWEDFFGGRAFGLTWLSVSGEGIYSYGKEQGLKTAAGGPDCSLAK